MQFRRERDVAAVALRGTLPVPGARLSRKLLRGIVSFLSEQSCVVKFSDVCGSWRWSRESKHLSGGDVAAAVIQLAVESSICGLEVVEHLPTEKCFQQRTNSGHSSSRAGGVMGPRAAHDPDVPCHPEPWYENEMPCLQLGLTRAHPEPYNPFHYSDYDESDASDAEIARPDQANAILDEQYGIFECLPEEVRYHFIYKPLERREWPKQAASALEALHVFTSARPDNWEHVAFDLGDFSGGLFGWRILLASTKITVAQIIARSGCPSRSEFCWTLNRAS